MTTTRPERDLSAVSDLARFRHRVAGEEAALDLDAAEAAAADLLRALGLPLDSEEMVETPRRMAQAYAEMVTAVPFELTTFPNRTGYDELVVVQDIPVRCLCEHHMLPFVGVAHIGYLPADRILGLSKFARLVELVARRPQTQERLTQEIAEQLEQRLQPRGVGVVLDTEHTCMTLRGAQARGSRTLTSAMVGELRKNPATRAEFLTLTRGLRTSR
jgi:GTP cyclohydrolase I